MLGVFCQRSHMSCDEGRPCKRCIARGCADQCRGMWLLKILRSTFFNNEDSDGKRKRRGRKRKNEFGEDGNESSDDIDVEEGAVPNPLRESSDTTESEDISNDYEEPAYNVPIAGPLRNSNDSNLFIIDEEEDFNKVLNLDESSFNLNLFPDIFGSKPSKYCNVNGSRLDEVSHDSFGRYSSDYLKPKTLYANDSYMVDFDLLM